MTNGWFPKLRADGVIASGNAGIWRTPLVGSPVPVSPVGTSPVWAGQSLVYNRNNNTTQVGAAVLPAAYNRYVGCDCGGWAGAVEAGAGSVQRYMGTTPIGAPILAACWPGFYGCDFGYLQPYQTGTDFQRNLIIAGTRVATSAIMGWFPDRGGAAFTYVFWPGGDSHARRIMGYDRALGFNDVTIRTQQDETPIVTFLGLDGEPWILSNSPAAGTFVRMIYSAFGYVIPGDLYYPDCRIIGDWLHVVGSLSDGTPRDVLIDFTAPKVDLRLL